MIDLNVKHKISLKFKEQIRVAKITTYSSYFTVMLAVFFLFVCSVSFGGAIFMYIQHQLGNGTEGTCINIFYFFFFELLFVMDFG